MIKKDSFRKFVFNTYGRISPYLILLTSFTFFGCNQVFFQPDRIIRTTPDQVGLDYTPGEIVTDDGVLSYWVIHAQEPRLGTVIHFHGNAQNMSTHFLFVGWLAQSGFDAITFDYRGYGTSDGAANRQGAIQDGQRILRKFSNASENLYVVGQSLGGAISVASVVKEQPKNLRLLILDSTFSSYRSLAREKLGEFFLTWPLQYPLSFLVTDEDSPIDYIGKLQNPVLFIHGREDKIVPFSQGKRLFEKTAIRDKMFWEIPGEGHTTVFNDPSRRQTFLNHLCDKHTDKSGCRAVFKVQLAYDSSHDTQDKLVKCESKDYYPKQCPIGHPSVISVDLQKRLSDTSCRGKWGYDYHSIWVEQGCRGVFRVVTANDYQYIQSHNYQPQPYYPQNGQHNYDGRSKYWYPW